MTLTPVAPHEALGGGTGMDTLNGSNGNDIMTGNGGNDLMIGGTSDTFIWDILSTFSTTTVSPPAGFSNTSDVVQNFVVANDLLVFKDVINNSGTALTPAYLDTHGYTVTEGTFAAPGFAAATDGPDVKLGFGTHGSVIIQGVGGLAPHISSFADLAAAGVHMDVLA